MTDTVNVRREPTRKMVNAGASACEYELSPAKIKETFRAMIAAAPKAEPVELTPSVYRLLQLADCALANVTAFEADARLIMGNTNYAITDNARSEIRQFLLAQPEAPKVEPVAWASSIALGIIKNGEPSLVWPSEDDGNPIALYTHPAPSSDELLEAIDMDDFNIVGEWIESGEKGSAPSGRVKGLWQSMRRVISIAKHKGPQS